jgi:hypothetical protein
MFTRVSVKKYTSICSFRPEIGWPQAKELEPAEELHHTLRQSQHSVSKPFSPTDGN